MMNQMITGAGTPALSRSRCHPDCRARRLKGVATVHFHCVHLTMRYHYGSAARAAAAAGGCQMIISSDKGSDRGPPRLTAARLRTSRVLKSPGRVAPLAAAFVLAVMLQPALTSSAGRPDHDHRFPGDGTGDLR
jgi:hypothetical protein